MRARLLRAVALAVVGVFALYGIALAVDPTVTAVSPTSGPTAGGTLVLITGTAFTGATNVQFGSKPATSFTVVSDTQITAVSPANSVGSVDIQVKTASTNWSATSSSDKFAYNTTPTITKTTPLYGPVNVTTTSVTVTGTGFSVGGTGTCSTVGVSAYFGRTAANSCNVDSDSQITLTTPSYASSGFVDISIVTIDGTTVLVTQDQFYFLQTPVINLYEAHAFTNVNQSGDLLVLIRYDIPTSYWQNPAFLTLANTTNWNAPCIDTNDVTDPCYTSVKAGVVQQTFYKSDSSLASVRDLPRVGPGLSAVYLPSTTITFGDTSTNIQTCIEQSTTVVPTATKSCIPLNWHTSTDFYDDQNVLKTQLIQIVLNLQQEGSFGRNGLVTVNRITIKGANFAREAFAAMTQVAPDAFTSDVKDKVIAFAPTPAAGLSNAIATAVAGNNVYTGLNVLSQEYLGFANPSYGIGLLFIAAGLIIMFGTILAGGNAPLGLAFGGIVLLAGVAIYVISAALVAVILIVGILIGAMWFWRRAPG